MAKLRKMLGDVFGPGSTALRELIDTQRKETLVNWAVDYAEAHYLPVYQKACPEDERLTELIGACREVNAGTRNLKEVKPMLKEGQAIAKELEDAPAAQAASRAVATACSTIQNLPGTLGFTFYGAAAAAYDRLGLAEKKEVYDAFAEEEMQRILKSLQEAAVPGETDPVKIKWNC
ncbi:MAG: hypothetical protein Q4F29_11460 [Lachnospiraceae bacterium]|nr:hypothetical protein [Lachnospiraceae bacterium]